MIGSEVEALCSLLKAHGDKVLSGGQRLALTAALAQKVSAAFSLLLASTNFDLHDFQVVPASSNARLHDLHFLHDFLQRVDALVVSHGADTLQGDVDLAKFRNLKELELSRVPLHLVSGLTQLQPRLVSVTTSKSISQVENLLGKNAWPDLVRLSLPHNTLAALDPSFSMATSLREVDLRHNLITDTQGLELLPCLVTLDLSYNRLERVPVLHRNASRTLKSFAIAHNMLEQLNGLEKFTNLEVFHCGWNCLVETQVLASFSKLPHLRKLWLSGNPLVRTKDHRERISRRLHPCIIPAADNFFLDGKNLSEQERRWIGAACLDTCIGTPSMSDAPEMSSSSVSRRAAKVREVVIADINEAPLSPPRLNSSVASSSTLTSETVETRRQIESLRDKFGETWLGEVKGVLGLPAEDPDSSNIEERFEAQAWLESHQKPTLEVQIEVTADEHQEEENEADVSKVELLGEVSFVTVECDPFMDDSMTEPSSSNMPIDSGNEHLNESEEDEDESGNEATYLAQREIVLSQTNTIVKDFFVIVGSRNLVERETSGKISARWPLDTLISCEHKSATNVILSFDTIRRDKENREYMLDAADAQSLSKLLNSSLEARSLGDLNQAAFRCMRCSAHFSCEVSDVNSTVGRCPNCNSAVVVQEDLQNRSFYEPKQPVISETPKGPSHQKKCSIGSLLDQSMSDSGLGLLPGQSRANEGNDSDIEVLSNPSQSSIEVIVPSEESHSREESAQPSSSSVESRGPTITVSASSPSLVTAESSSF